MATMRKYIALIIVSLIGFQARSENFSCKVHDAEIVGTPNSVVCRRGGEEMEMDLPEGMVLRGIDTFGDGVIAITKGNHILFWDSPFDKARRIRIEMKGEFKSIDAGSEMCYALSDSSEIVSLNRALISKVFDFNGEYAAYYGKVDIIDIAVGPASLCIAVTKEDGKPTAYASSKGTVWSERELDYAINGVWHTFEKVPHRITYEELSDSFALHCDDGDTFHLPNCSHCNYVVRSSTSL